MKRITVVVLMVIGLMTLFAVNCFAIEMMVAAGYRQAVGLKTNGTIVTAGQYGFTEAPSWNHIQHVAINMGLMMGVKSNGTVVFDDLGWCNSGNCDVSSWTNIKQLALSGSHAVGLKTDGTVVATGKNDDGQCEVSSWKDIKQIAAHGYNTIGLKTDGTVVAVGNNDHGQCDVNSWTDIKQIAFSGATTIGLKTDGTVITIGQYKWDFSSWSNIKQVAPGFTIVAGLKEDGTVIVDDMGFSYGINVSSWSDIQQISVGETDILLGLKSDGTVFEVTATQGYGCSKYGYCDASSWMLSVGPPLPTWYLDADGDGYGDPNNSFDSNTAPSGYVSDYTDCDDTDDTVYPGASDNVADGIDNDCDGSIDEDATVSSKTWYYDSDGDGYGDPNASFDSDSAPSGYVSDDTDCDDKDDTVYPGATEIAGDGIDNDCDGSIDEGSSTSSTWYLDADGDGYGDPNKPFDAGNAPAGYVSDNTDCDDTDDTIYPGATEIAGDNIDQDCDGSDQAAGSTTSGQISILSPSDNETIGYGSSGGKVTFSFSKITDAAKYILQLNLYDILSDLSIAVPVELTPPGTSSGSIWGGGSTATGTPGFSEQFIGMVYELSLDSATWDVLSMYDIQWGVEAYDDSGALIGSTYLGSTASKYVYGLKFIASNSITMTSPTNGSSLTKTDSAPTFQWDTYQGASTYTLILAHVGTLGFDSVLAQDNLTLNLYPMDASAWSTMPTGTWYWTVFGYTASGTQTPSDFTIFDFEVQ